MNQEKVTSLVWTLLWLIIGFQSIGAFAEGGREAALTGGDDKKDDQNITPVMSQQLPSSFPLLIVKVLNDMENRMEDKLSQLRNVVNVKMCLLESKRKSQLSQFQNGSNSQLSNLQNILKRKIDTLDTKTENRLTQNFNNLHDKFDGLKNRMEDRFKSTDEKLIYLKEHLNTRKDSTDPKKNERATCQKKADVKPQTLQSIVNARIKNFRNHITDNTRGGLKAKPDNNKTGEIFYYENQTREVLDDLTATNSTQSQHLEAPSAIGCYRGMAKDTTKQRLELMRDDTLDRDILCDTQTDGGGWIVIQRRTKGDVDFYRNWAAYKNGFGTPPGDFWLGNEAIYKLTNKDAYELRIDINDGTQDLFAVYSSFRLESEAENYRLRLGSYSGTLGDNRTAGEGLSYHTGMEFSTYDRDNDRKSDENCAEGRHGAWWYRFCLRTNLNGRWGGAPPRGLWWYSGGVYHYASSTEMKMRIK